MNLKSIEYFLITVEEMNFTRAAGRLYISQQALSSHISRLEEENGIRNGGRRSASRRRGKRCIFTAAVFWKLRES